MVKGISKRVVVVKAPISSIFDEAIFILNETSASSVDAENILKEACLLADSYVKKNCHDKKAPVRLKLLIMAIAPVLVFGISLAIYFALK